MKHFFSTLFINTHIKYAFTFVAVLLVVILSNVATEPGAAADTWKVAYTEDWADSAAWSKFNAPTRSDFQGPRIPENFTVQEDSSGRYARLWTRPNTNNTNLPTGAWASAGGALRDHRFNAVKIDAKVRLSQARGVRGVMLLWPSNGSWSEEIDFYEIGAESPTRDRMKVSMHHPKTKFVEIYGKTNLAYPAGNHRMSTAFDSRDYSQWRDVQVILQEGLLQVSIDGDVIYRSTTDVPYYAKSGTFRDKNGATYNWDGKYFLGMQTAAPGRGGVIDVGYMDVGKVTVSVPGVPAPAPDTIDPRVTITAQPQRITLGSAVTVQAAVRDNVAVTKVEFYLNGILMFTDNTAPYTARWHTAYIGSKTLTAKAYDAAGNVAVSPDHQITVTPISSL